MTPVFYAPDITAHPVLPEEESAHAIRVLRMKEGDALTITDGKGVYYQATITLPHPKHCEVSIHAQQQIPSPWRYRLHIAIAPPKNMERMEWFAEKATETGIHEITCLHCRYSERREIKTTRIHKILISAMKQSQQASLPVLNDVTLFSDFVARPFTGQKFIACCCESVPKQTLKHAYLPGENALILIGPEGDFSKDEISLALQNRFIPISLGPTRLRTETAALVACHTIHLINMDE
ncbi:MAG: 16S rRNA (uracil(1498)-N(3))-methyltransferase [Tannerella sp.]|jgi:16S rRNA (uracil1498-N3)-methyltransferase|nr:16S rRNA (uracil(1498)-N(3))-methyltransferase [Tannerella sp.]